MCVMMSISVVLHDYNIIDQHAIDAPELVTKDP